MLWMSPPPHLVHAALDQPLDPALGFRRDQRSDVRTRLAAGADFQGLGARDEAVPPAIDAADKHGRRDGHAALPRGSKGRARQRRERGFEVCIR
jgi:hypothetical protein